MILVDTSVWVDHFRRANPDLADALQHGEVSSHPFVIGELALGLGPSQSTVIPLLEELPRAREATHHDAMSLVDHRRLAGSGIGWVDAHLLASALLDRSTLWTLDNRLRRAADACGVRWSGPRPK